MFVRKTIYESEIAKRDDKILALDNLAAKRGAALGDIIGMETPRAAAAARRMAQRAREGFNVVE